MSRMQVGDRTVTIGAIRDIAGRKAYTEALEHRALHDDLTGLPNRTLFGDRMDRAIASADRAGEPRGVLLVDLDEFREVNETLGRETGDELLKAVAERLCGAMGDSDTVARLRGDEFGILRAGETDVETAAVVAWKVREALEHPFVIGGHVVDVRASIGIAFFPEHGRATADLLRRADLAMHQAKESGSGLAVFATRAGGPDRAPADAPERAPRLHPARRARAALSAQDRPDGRRAGPPASRRWCAGTIPSHGLLSPPTSCPRRSAAS